VGVSRKALVIGLALAASGTLVPAAVGDEPPVAPQLPSEAVRTSRIRCPEENVTNVLDPVVKRGDNDYVRFRLVTEYAADLLYAHRPHNRYRSHGTDIVDGRDDPPGTYRLRLPLARGTWLIGCFEGDFSTFDHPRAHYDEIEVVRPS
jgi:hypothetical protein